MRLGAAVALALSAVGFQVGVVAEPLGVPAERPAEQSAPSATYPDRVFWGDTHVHTSLSVDAYTTGTVAPGPREAFRFARGGTVQSTSGSSVRLAHPLDFLVVSDHAEYLGVLQGLDSGTRSIKKSPEGARWYKKFHGGDHTPSTALELVETWSTGERMFMSPEYDRKVWESVVAAADETDGWADFTAFAGFEWSSTSDGNNLHRVVVFRDGAEKTLKTRPFSALDSSDPEDLWRYLSTYETKTGGAVLAIPHNPNLSNGLMFAKSRFDGTEINERYALQRQRWEPIVEITQIKGDSETHPLLSPNDEFSDYGRWDVGNLLSTARKQPSMLQYEYIRSALRIGLELKGSTGVNPFQFGVIGSTDAHTGMSTTEEDNFWGKAPPFEPLQPHRLEGSFTTLEGTRNIKNWQQLSSGLAAVWATENSRTALFEAMKRREVYATTGPRIVLRFFGGWDYVAEDMESQRLVAAGYQKGVPMGGVLKPVSGDSDRPTFLISALRDPTGASLDRVQVVKGWVDENGRSHERVYDVAWSGGKERQRNGRLIPVDSTVDLQSGDYRSMDGAAELRTLWSDSDFHPMQPAFYYARVIEIPTPRWPLYDHARLGARLPEGVELTHQERAYSSPIWYEPSVRH